MFGVFLAHYGLLEQLFGIGYEEGVFDADYLGFGLFEHIDSTNIKLNTIKLRTKLQPPNRIPKIPNPPLLLLINRHPQNSSHRRHNINIKRRKLTNPNRMRLPMNTNKIQLMRFLIPNIFQLVPIVDLGSPHALEEIEDDVVAGVQDEFGLFAD